MYKHHYVEGNAIFLFFFFFYDMTLDTIFNITGNTFENRFWQCQIFFLKMNSEMGYKDDDDNNNAIENHLLNQCHKRFMEIS